MNLATAMLYPIVLLLPASGAVDEGRSDDESAYEVSDQSIDGTWESYVEEQQ